MRKTIFLSVLLFLFPFYSEAGMVIQKFTSAAGGSVVQTGSVYTINGETTNSGSVTDVTIPSAADVAIIFVGGSGYWETTDLFSNGSVTLDSQSATLVTGAYQENQNQQMISAWTVSGFTTGINKTLAWDWSGTDAVDGLHFAVYFLDGADTVTPVRSSGSESVTDDGEPTCGTLTAQSGDEILATMNAYHISAVTTWTGTTSDGSFAHASLNAVGVLDYSSLDPSGNTLVSADNATSNYCAVSCVVIQP